MSEWSCWYSVSRQSDAFSPTGSASTSTTVTSRRPPSVFLTSTDSPGRRALPRADAPYAGVWLRSTVSTDAPSRYFVLRFDDDSTGVSVWTRRFTSYLPSGRSVCSFVRTTPPDAESTSAGGDASADADASRSVW